MSRDTEAALRSIPSESFSEVCALREDALGPDCVLLGWRGSVAHGTYVAPEDPDAFDDRDLMGICMPSVEHYFGLSQFGSRGTVEVQHGEWDVVCYENRKALGLLAKGNPNVLAMLWMPEEMYVFVEPAGRALLERRELFSSKSAYPAFRGYAQSQAKKMERGNAYDGYMGKKRKELVDRFGYDVKNASHAVRILRQGVEFLSTGKMAVWREDAEELLDIKQGGWSLESVREEIGRLDALLEAVVDTSPLPDRVDRAQVDALAVKVASLRFGETSD